MTLNQDDLSKIDWQADQLQFISPDQAVSPHESEQLIDTYQDQNAAQYLNQLLIEAIHLKASDIHFEPASSQMRLRLRIDGVMQPWQQIPMGFATQIVSRLKVIAALDVAEQRSAKSGHFQLKIDAENSLDFRCSLVPSVYGEILVLRLLYMPEQLLQLENLGMSVQQQQLVEKACRQPQGLIIVSGPTGCGKTVTLYSLLRLINQQQRAVYTVEDPVEVNLPGINQINIAQQKQIDFNVMARAVLRQDPDVIMVGEIRDQQTLETALQAAHTGHLVLTSVHAATAAMAISRLKNISNDPAIAADLANTCSLIINQRLLRKKQISQAKIDGLAAASEYQGRVGVFQILPVTRPLAKLIASDADAQDLGAFADEQWPDLHQQAEQLLGQGITDRAEVLRVLGSEPEQLSLPIQLES